MLSVAVGLLSVVLAWSILTSQTAFWRGGICVFGVILFVLYLNDSNVRFAQASAKTATTNPEKLAQTPNPNVKRTAGDESAGGAATTTADGEKNDDEKEALPQTKNSRPPHHEGKEESPPPIISNLNTPAYTQAGMQALWDERTFRPDVNFRQSYASRERMLNGMYQELLDTSAKRDPALRRTSGESCRPIRGNTKPHVL